MLALVLAVAALSPAAETGPRLVVEPEAVDLGVAYLGGSASGEVVLRNAGDEPLVVRDVKTSCGCTVARLAAEDRTLAPGASVTLPITMTPKGKASPMSKTIEVRTNDPWRPVVKIRATTRVEIGVDLDPEFLLFRDVELGGEAGAELTLTSGDGEPFAIKDVVPQSDLYSVDFTGGVAATEHVVSVRVGPVHRRANPPSALIIATTHPKAPSLRVNANLIVASAIAKSANYLAFGEVEAGGVATTDIALWDRRSGGALESVSIRQDRFPDVALDAERDADDPKLWHVTLRVPEGFEGRLVSGPAVVETDLETLTLMFTARLAGS